MTLLERLASSPAGIPVWQRNGSSVVGWAQHIDTEAVLIEVTILNKMPRKRLLVRGSVFEADWSGAPCIDPKWLNVGSAWTHLDRIPHCGLRQILQGVHNEDVVLGVTNKNGSNISIVLPIHFLTAQCIRVWGVGESFPTKPIPYVARKKPGQSENLKTALEILLGDDFL
jgi:hypothetical protein